MAEGTALLKLHRGNSIEGSNPSLSATFARQNGVPAEGGQAHGIAGEMPLTVERLVPKALVGELRGAKRVEVNALHLPRWTQRDFYGAGPGET